MEMRSHIRSIHDVARKWGDWGGHSVNRVKPLSLIFFAAASLLLSACGSTERVRYKMVVEVETPEGLRTGSAVREVSYVHASPLAIFTKDGVWVEGEAVAVDLPGERTLFAVLQSADGNLDYSARLPEWLMNWRREGDIYTEPIELYPGVPTDTRPRLSLDGKRPLLVSFRDRRDPTSVLRVEPTNIAAQFGDGFRLRSINVSATDDAVTKKIRPLLPWVASHRGQLVPQPDDVPMFDTPVEHRLQSHDFATRI